MPRPTATRMGACVRSTACLASRNSSSGLRSNLLRFEVHRNGSHWRLRGALRHQIRSKRARLKGCEPGGRAFEHHIRRGLALKHLAHKNQFPVFVAVADAVANHAFAERRGQLGREIAHLISVRQQHQIGLGLRDHLLESDGVAIGRVRREQIVLNEQHFIELAGRKLAGQRRNAFADDHGSQAALRLRGNLLRGGQRFKAGLVPLCVALFGDQENVHGCGASPNRLRALRLTSYV